MADVNVTTEPIIGGPAPVATLDQVAAYFLGNDARQVDDTGVAEIVNALWEYGGRVGIRPDLAAAQIAHETNVLAFGGDVNPAQHNPAGIGTTGGGVKGVTFADWRTGIAAYFVHLLTWCGQDDLARVLTTAPASLDPRVPLVRQARATKGPATTWASLGGRWAVPGETYAAGIERHYSAILALPAPPGAQKGPSMTVVSPPIDTSHQSPNRGGYANPHKPEALCWHVTVGGAAGSISWLTNPASNASANYLIDRAGKIYELVPPTESAWCNGQLNKPDMANPVIKGWVDGHINPNTRTISIENERTTSANEQPGGFTEAQHKSLVALSAWLCASLGIAPDRTHIIRHGQIDSVTRAHCPGLAESEMVAWVGEIAALVNGSVPVPADPGFPGALQPDGATKLNTVDFGGTAVSVEEVIVQVRNQQGERYRRRWVGYKLDDWERI